MDKTLKIALILTAVDKMSSVIANATTASNKRLMEMQKKSAQYLQQGMALGGAGAVGFGMLHKASESFEDLQDASLKMKAAMLQDGGVLDETTFKKLDEFTNKISAQLTGSAADYKAMVTVMMENGLRAQDILGGTGAAVANLAVLFDMAPSSIGQFAARMKQDMGIANNEMIQMTDMVARLKNAGVGKTGEEAVMEMQEAFSKAGLGASNLGIKGVEAAKSLGSLMGLFIRRGISGSTVGNNFRRIFDGLRDVDKLKKSNEVARQFGITLDFYDKKGNFKGIDNFIGQIGKLEGLGTQKTAAILKPFGGKQGLSTDFLEFLGKEGTQGFNEFQYKQFIQATSDQKVAVMLSGQRKQAEITRTTWKNTWAAIGASFSPELIKLYQQLNKVAVWVKTFTEAHPDITRFVTISLAAVSALLSIVGAIKLVQFAFVAMRIVMLGNPVTLVIMAIALAAVAIYTNWGKIKDFFSGLWASVVQIFSKAWNWVKNSMLVYFFPPLLIFKYWDKLKPFFAALWDLVKAVFRWGLGAIKFVLINFSPVGLIFKYWDKLKPYFVAILKSVYQPFLDMFNFVWNLGKMFYNAGTNIMNSIVDGITAKISKVTDVIKKVTQTIRNYFPFSPAKEGPLKDIHKIKLVETIVQGIKTQPAVNAMQNVAGAMAGVRPNGYGGGGMTVQFNFNGVSGDIVGQIKSRQREIIGVLKEAQRQVDRTKF